jgi:protein gp37
MPLEWKNPQMIFVNSMSDLFHENVPNEFILKVFETMKKASWHTFQVLTKRSERLLELDKIIDWPINVWMGVSVENKDVLFRIEHLRNTHALTKFLSIEPLLGPLPNLNLNQMNWVIVGGESGPGARPMDIEWVRDIRNQCNTNNVPFFFKQWGGINKKKAGRDLDGRTWNELPKATVQNYAQAN